MNEMPLGTRQGLGAYFRERCAGEENRPKFAPTTEIDRAIDLSCRACGAMAMGAGLGFPVGDSAALRFHPQPPIFLRFYLVAEVMNQSQIQKCVKFLTFFLTKMP